MKLIFKSVVQGLIEIIIFLPLLIMFSIYILNVNEVYLWLITLLFSYGAGSIFRKIVGKNKNVALYLIIGVIISFVNIQWFFDYSIFQVFILTLLNTFIFYRGKSFMDNEWGGLLPSNIIMMCIVSYTLLLLSFFYVEKLKPYNSMIQVAAVITLIIGLIRINALEIKMIVTPDNDKVNVPKSLVKNNLVLTVVAIVLIFIVSTINHIRDIILTVIKSIGKVIYFLYGLFTNMISYSTSENMGPGELEYIDSAIIKDETLLDKIIEVIKLVVLYGVIILIGILFIYLMAVIFHKVIKGLISFFKILMEYLNKENKNVLYEEEKEMIMNWKDLKEKYLEKINNWIDKSIEKEKKWEDLKDNKERIRYLYRVWIFQKIKNGYSFKSSYTPEEVYTDLCKWNGDMAYEGSEELIKLYNKSRYGNKELEDKIVIELRNTIDKKKVL
ncbi:hypothetical protein EDC18_1211 [Natranaerovirga pectinivora]|uniref:DUF4129 domain-containing protein n=1 Tax=Natranaerovirga pectinivora TaxID=682400 RepID=A0A4R3MCZ9_9FIRM|nr:hypothetical protein [Natranaerovirga pectinivora]TCT11604.1 hypothetical protein EDC18_1211 [Natranaerovirga pectinivora]